MLVSVHFNDSVKAFFESVAISGEANDGEDDAGVGVVSANAEDFGDEA